MSEEMIQIIKDNRKLIIENEFMKDTCIIHDGNDSENPISRCGTYEYLDFKLQSDTIGLCTYSKYIELQRKEYKCRANNNFDLKKIYNVDMDSFIFKSLLDENTDYVFNKIKSIIYKSGDDSYLKSWSKNDIIKNKITTFLSKYLPFLKIKIYKKSYKIKGKQNSNDIQKCFSKVIRYHSYIMAMTNRIGNADIIITNGRIGSLLQDCAPFSLDCSNYDNISHTKSIPYCIGTYNNMKLYIDPYIKWDDNSIYLVKTPNKNLSGIRYIYNDDLSTFQKITEEHLDTLFILNDMQYVNYIGSNNLMVDKICIDIPKNVF